MKSLKQWYESPAFERVTNFSREFVEKCKEKHLGNYHDSTNLTSQLSQVDFEVDDTQQHALEQDMSMKAFTEMIAIDDPELQTPSEREQTFQHYMYELKNQFDFNNASQFSSLMKELTMIRKRAIGAQLESRKRKGDTFLEKEGSVPFPNTPFGRKTKSKRE